MHVNRLPTDRKDNSRRNNIVHRLRSAHWASKGHNRRATPPAGLGDEDLPCPAINKVIIHTHIYIYIYQDQRYQDSPAERSTISRLNYTQTDDSETITIFTNLAVGHDGAIHGMRRQSHRCTNMGYSSTCDINNSKHEVRYQQH